MQAPPEPGPNGPSIRSRSPRAVSLQLSAISYQLSAISFQLSAISTSSAFGALAPPALSLAPRLCRIPRSRAPTAPRQSGRGFAASCQPSAPQAPSAPGTAALSMDPRLCKLPRSRAQTAPRQSGRGFAASCQLSAPQAPSVPGAARTFHGPPAVQAPPEPGPNGTPSIRASRRFHTFPQSWPSQSTPHRTVFTMRAS